MRSLIFLCCTAALAAGDAINLVPTTPGTAPSYWCSWGTQGRKDAWRSDHPYRSDARAVAAQANRMGLDEAFLFGQPGLATNGFERVRGDLWLVIDDGWDVSYTTAHDNWKDHSDFGSQILDAERFPSFSGTPAERLTKLNAKLKEHGWRGLGLWIAANPVGKGMQKYDRKTWEPYFRERLQWSRAAGVGVWKVDWGVAAMSTEFRQWLTAMARTEAPNLVVETAWPKSGPFHQDKDAREALPIMAWSDLFRTYDVILATPTTLARCSVLLTAPKPTSPALGLINIESQLYLGAGLGCTLGIMSHPRFQPETELLATRALHWQRIAPPWSVGDGVALSSESLAEVRITKDADKKSSWWSHHAKQAKAIDAQGNITQSAAAITARGLPLDAVQVVPTAPAPYVVASRHPNGTMAVAVLPRRSGAIDAGAADGAVVETTATPGSAAITLRIGAATAPIGIFGPVGDLTLMVDAPIGTRSVLMQDLAADAAVDITERITVSDATLRIPAEVLREVGNAKRPDLLGAVIVIR